MKPHYTQMYFEESDISGKSPSRFLDRPQNFLACHLNSRKIIFNNTYIDILI